MADDINVAFSASTSKPALTAGAEQRELLRSWVNAHGDYLLRYAMRYVRNRDQAEDLVQEAFLAAVDGIFRFEGRSSPRTWLTGILRHKVLDRLRESSKQQPLDVEALEGNELFGLFDKNGHWIIGAGPVAWAKDPDSILEQRQFFSVLQGCLDKVPERFRQIFLLRELEGFSRDEIASQLKLTVTNVGVILYRVRLSLQRCLQVNWFEGVGGEAS